MLRVRKLEQKRCSKQQYRMKLLSQMTVHPLRNTINALTAVGALMKFIDFTLSNAGRFYSSIGNPLAVKGLSDFFSSLSFLSLHCTMPSTINFSFLIRHCIIKADGSSNGKGRVICVKNLIDNDLFEPDGCFFPKRTESFI